ncbi:pyridoxamine 5'-phosphate oxidase family protein [Methanocella arvoryzae]|nr:pyridoxamine 5'-phosphate oxidase family protein [Methanocella arvoryzae]
MMTILPEMTRAEMEQLLAEERVGRVGLNDDPQPYIVPTDFAYLGGVIYIHTPAAGRKARLARSNPHVCFEVDRYNSTVTDFQSIIIRGRITEVSSPDERRKAMQMLAEKAARSGGVIPHGKSPGNSARIAIFKIDIGDMTGIKSPANGHP